MSKEEKELIYPVLGKRRADSDDEPSEADDEEDYSVSNEESEQEEKPGRFKRPISIK